MKGSLSRIGQCLGDDVLTDYLEGGLEAGLKAGSEVHLLACDRCRVRLAFFMRLMSPAASTEEVAAVDSIQQIWMREGKDRQIAKGPTIGRRMLLASGGVAAAALLAIGVKVTADRLSEPEDADAVIRLLLSRKRPFEARISRQPYLPFVARRGAAESSIPFQLLASEIDRLGPSLADSGRFHLLKEEFSSAIQYLERAGQELGAGPDVHNDLGVAYMESQSSGNLAKANAEFLQAIALKGDYSPAHYNLALLYYRMGKDDLAQQRWSRLLEIEKDTKWLDEARSKLERIKR